MDPLTDRRPSCLVAADRHPGRHSADGPWLPTPRGPFSATILSALERPPGSLGAAPPVVGLDALADEDLQLALYCCYELHYRGFAGVDAEWEWDPILLGFRAELEGAFLDRLREEIGPTRPAGDVRDALVGLIAGASGPSLSTFMAESGTLEQLREFCIHRSAYQLKEADPHTFAIPRLTGEAKAAIVEIQYDEYGCGRVWDMHSSLFTATMTALGLDPTYGGYLDRLPAATLATVNLVSLFALHRRWRGALVGHLAVFEMTSVGPMARYSQALACLGVGSEGRRFYEVHVTADARHATIALDRMVAGLSASDRRLDADLLFGAAAVLLIEDRFARHLLEAWTAGRTSLTAAPGAGASRSVPEADGSQSSPFPVVGPDGLEAAAT